MARAARSELRAGLAFRTLAARFDDRAHRRVARARAVDGIVPMLRRTANVNWHRATALALLKNAGFRRIVLSSLCDLSRSPGAVPKRDHFFASSRTCRQERRWRVGRGAGVGRLSFLGLKPVAEAHQSAAARRQQFLRDARRASRRCASVVTTPMPRASAPSRNFSSAAPRATSSALALLALMISMQLIRRSSIREIEPERSRDLAPGAGRRRSARGEKEPGAARARPASAAARHSPALAGRLVRKNASQRPR